MSGSRHLYLMQSTGMFKIGIANDLSKRLRQFRTGTPFPIRLVASYPCTDAAIRERTWHHRYAAQRVRGEWFRLSDAQACAFIEEEAERVIADQEARITDLQTALEHERRQTRSLNEALLREQQLRLLTAPIAEEAPPAPDMKT